MITSERNLVRQALLDSGGRNPIAYVGSLELRGAVRSAVETVVGHYMRATIYDSLYSVVNESIWQSVSIAVKEMVCEQY